MTNITEPVWCARGCYSFDRHLADCEHRDWHTPACVDDDCPGCNEERCDGCQPRDAVEGLLCESCCRVLGVLLAGPDETDGGAPVQSVAYACRYLADQLHNPLRCNLGKSGRGSGEDDAFVRVFAALSDLQIAWAELAVDFLGGVDARPAFFRQQPVGACDSYLRIASYQGQIGRRLETVWKPSPPGHRAERPDFRSLFSNK